MANKQFNSVDGYAVGNSGSTFNVIDATGNITASGSITRNSRNVPTFVHQADTPPSNPLVGDQWYNTTTGVLFEYLNDGTTSQWVDINGLPGVVGPIVLPGGTANAVVYLNSSGETVSSSSFVFDGTNVGIGNTAPAHTLSVTGTINVSGNANVGNIGATNGVFTSVSGNGSSLSAIAGANVTGQVGNALVAGTVYTAAQPNITSVGTLTSLTVTGNTFLATTSGNLLVGTTTSDNKLTVSSSSSGAAAGVLTVANPNDATNTAADFDFVTHSSGTLATGRIRGFVAGADNYPMSFWTYGGDGLAERMRITAAGDVGIGTTAPQTPFGGRGLQVGSPSDTTSVFTLQSSAVGSLYFSDGTTGTDAYVGYLQYNHTENSMAFGTGATERMRIDSSGNVGIGTSSPGARIAVAAASPAVGSRGTAYLFSTNAMGANLGGQLSFGGSFTGTSETVFGSIAGRKETGTDNDISGYLQFSTTNASLGNVERMRIDSSGNVGIGVSSPSQALHVRRPTDSVFLLDSATAGYGEFFAQSSAGLGLCGTLNALPFGLFTSALERMRITATGNVGIGTSSPGDRLHVDGGNIRIGSSTGANYIYSASSDLLGIQVGTGPLLFLRDNGSNESMRIDSSGNVGIGTSSPNERLVVAGSQINNVADDAYAVALNAPSGNVRILPYFSPYTSSALISYAAGYAGLGPFTIDASNIRLFTGSTERMRIDSSGNVGIGTSSPTARLHVSDGFSSFVSNDTNGYARITTADASAQLGLFRSGTTAGGGYIGANGDASFIAYSGAFAERMRIDSSGNLLVGAASQTFSSRTEITSGNANLLALYNTVSNGGAKLWLLDGNSSAAIGNVGPDLLFYTAGNSSERMRIDSSGNVGIGNSSPGYRLDIAAGDTTAGLGYAARFRSNATAAAAALQFTNNAVTAQNGLIACTDAGILTVQGDGASSVIAFRTNGSERARIDSSGNLLVAKTADVLANVGHLFNANGSFTATRNGDPVGYLNRLASDGEILTFWRSTVQVGNISVTASATAYNTSSDARLKHDIVDAPAASDLIDAIQVRSFKWNADDSEQRFGMIAQELVQVAPEAVNVPEDEDQMMGVDYSKLVPILTKALQEANSKIDALEARMSALESAITNLSEGN